MALKILGSILIIASSGLAGLYFAYKPYYRKSDLNSFFIALEILENEINNYSSLIEASFQISQKVSDKNISEIFLYLCEKLKEKNGEETEKIWTDSINKYKSSLYLNQEDYDTIAGMGKILNSFDREIEIKNIAVLKRYILTSIDEINIEYTKNRRMFQSIGFLGGLIIVIALI